MAGDGAHSVVRLLLEAGADPNARDDGLNTPLHAAIERRANLKTIETLKEYGADPDLKNNHGKTPLDLAELIPNPKGTAISEVFSRAPIGEGEDLSPIPSNPLPG